MKKFIYILSGLVLCAPTFLKAQKVTIADPSMYTVPSIYTMDEEVTWYFDFGNSPQVDDKEPLFMWTWSPNTPTDPNVQVPLKDEGGRVYSLTMTPITFYRTNVQDILNNGESNFWFNIRNSDVSKETGTLSFPKRDIVKDFVDGGKQMDYGPANFQLGSTLTILFNANLVDGFLPAPSTVHLHSGLNDWSVLQEFQVWLPEIREKTMFRDLGNGIYEKHLVPQTYYGVDEEFEMENITFVVAKYNGNAADPQWAGTGPDMKILAPGVPIPPPANFYFFPLKVSQDDILIITRENNDRGQRLNYTVTGGTKTLTGDMEGAMAQQRAYINIAGEFKGMNISKLSVLVKDQNDRTIYEGDIPFVTVDNLTK
uniref:Uncharacterized protein n=1 Tax=termite gut metagenome TaxID=433724 RepID=S0DES6_9ZZZZ